MRLKDPLDIDEFFNRNIDKTITFLIDRGYSREIAENFPASILISLMKTVSPFIFIFGIGSLIAGWGWLSFILLVIISVICYWLAGLLRGRELRIMLKREENIEILIELLKGVSNRVPTEYSNVIFPTCRKCSKTTSKVGNYTNMYLSGILDPEEFDKKYGMMCGDHAGEATGKIMAEINLSSKDFAKAHRKALMALDQELLG